MAIAITLLVLDLRVPTAADVAAAGGLLPALLARWPSYVAYVAAFLTIAIVWLNHHTLIRNIARFDERLHWLNILLLFGVATLPFPTALMADYVEGGGRDASVAAATYGLVGVVLALPWFLTWRHLRARPDLLEPGYDVRGLDEDVRRNSVGLPVYAAATLVGLVAPLLALALYVGIALLYGVTSQRRGGARSR
jgi:uncharacterized membrane protein